jgi:hypothetical protein
MDGNIEFLSPVCLLICSCMDALCPENFFLYNTWMFYSCMADVSGKRVRVLILAKSCTSKGNESCTLKRKHNYVLVIMLIKRNKLLQCIKVGSRLCWYEREI